MAKHIEQPVVTKVEDKHRQGETRTTHPAFAQISASRVSGNQALYGSDFRHQHFMTITIKRSELCRDLNRDWHFDREQLIEVALTESQWATFVSATNVGSGVPCTLERFNGQSVPGLPDPESRANQFKAELHEDLHNMIEKVSRTINMIDDMGLPKGKANTLKSAMESVKQTLKSSVPFVASQFDEHMEKTVEKAKQEVHGYMTSTLQRAGLDALTGGTLPLQIDHVPDQED